MFSRPSSSVVSSACDLVGTWAVAWSRTSRHDLRRLQRQVADRVIRAVERHAGTGQGDVAKLEGPGNA